MVTVSRRYALYCIIGIAVVLRLLLILNPGFEADISFWKSWGLATYDYGIVEGMKITNNNYPTPFAYILGAMVFIYSKFADPHNFNQFWQNTNLLFLTISKLVPILADFGVAALIVYIGKYAKRLSFPTLHLSFFGLSFYELLASVYLLSPLSLADGAWWGQVDSLGVCIFIGAVILALSKKPFLAGAVFMLAMMTKLQNMIYGPLFFLFIWQTLGFAGLVRALVGACVGFVGLNIEFFAAKNADRILAGITENYDYFPWMSLNAYNLWWIVSGARGMGMSDKMMAIGMLNAKTVGLLIFSASYLFATLHMFLHSAWLKNRENFSASGGSVLMRFLESLIIANAAFFLFQTQSHDRYAFPLSVFLLLWAPFYLSQFDPKVMKKKLILFSTFYILFTLFYFYNLHTALIINYPENGMPILSAMTQPMFTIPASVVLLALFAVFVTTLFRASQRAKIALGIAGTVLVTALLALNLPYLTKKPVSLTSLTPFIRQQQFGSLQINRTTNSNTNNPYSWARLSVQYIFYDQGLGTHANSQIVYDIDRKFRSFTTDFGIDTQAGGRASAVFAIYGDDKLLYESPKMGRFTMPGHAQVDVTGVKRLKLVTTDTGDSNFDDHTDWLNPKLYP